MAAMAVAVAAAAAAVAAVAAWFRGPVGRAALQAAVHGRVALQRAGLLRDDREDKYFATQGERPPSREVQALAWVLSVLPKASETDGPREVVEGLQGLYELGPFSGWRPATAKVRRDTLACGMPVLWVRAPGASGVKSSRAVVLYLHGGAYVAGNPAASVGFCEQVSRRARCPVLAPDFPLAPKASMKEMRGAVMRAYEHALDKGAESVVVVGDSSGGGLALGMMQDLSGSSLPQPRAAVLVSPVCDLALTSRSMLASRTRDVIFQHKHFFEVSHSIVLHDEPDPKAAALRADISPAFGAFEGLPPLLVFVAEEERARDDGCGVARRAKAAGVDVQLERHPYGVHNYPLFYSFGVPEYEEALERLCAFVQTHVATSAAA